MVRVSLKAIQVAIVACYAFVLTLILGIMFPFSWLAAQWAKFHNAFANYICRCLDWCDYTVDHIGKNEKDL